MQRPLGPHDHCVIVELVSSWRLSLPGGRKDNASESATNARLFPLSPDLPVMEERARGGETLEGHDCPSPAACGPVAPAEGLSGAEGGPGGRGPGSPSCPHHFMHNARPGPPAMGEGRTLTAWPGRGPRNRLGPISIEVPAPSSTRPALGEGLWEPFSCFAPFFPDLLTLKKWGRA